jgi:hypothetical protein
MNTSLLFIAKISQVIVLPTSFVLVIIILIVPIMITIVLLIYHNDNHHGYNYAKLLGLIDDYDYYVILVLLIFYQIVDYQTFSSYPTLNKPLVYFLEQLAFMIMSHSLQLPCKGHCPLNILYGYYPILCSLVLHKVQNLYNNVDNTHAFGRCLNSRFVFSFKPFCFHLLVNIFQFFTSSLFLDFFI